MFYLIKVITPIFLWSCLIFNLHLAVVVKAADKSHDVERYSNRGVSVVQHPAKGENLFRNTLCFFSFCLQRKAKCSGMVSCCWCRCKVGYTFYSYEKGCLSGPQINAVNEDEQCTIYSKSVDQQTVPLFTEARPASQVELRPDEYFPITENVTCYAGYLHYYAYVDGKHHLLDDNHCERTAKVYVDQQNRLMFRFGSKADEKWKDMAGLLLSTEIHCETKDGTQWYSSCFMFQIAGDSSKKLKPKPVDSNGTCPVEILPTENTIANTDKMDTNAAPLAEDGMNKGIIIGAVVAVLLALCCVVAALFLIRRRKIKARSESQNATLITYDRPELRRNTNENHDIKDKKKKKRDSKSSLKNLAEDDGSVLYVDVPHAEEYTSIDGDHEYEQPIKVLDGTHSLMGQRDSNGYNGEGGDDDNEAFGRSVDGVIVGRGEISVFSRNNDIVRTVGRNGSIRRDGTLGRNGSFRRDLGRNGSFRYDGSLRRDGTLGRNGSVGCDCSLRRDGTLGSGYDGSSLRRDGTLGRGGGGFDMSKRPLPERPQVENPYYEAQDSGAPINDTERQSEDNELYSLYSSIRDLKPQ